MSPTHYRLYSLDRRGGINLADWLDAPNDEVAIERARRMEQGAQKVEIWQRNRLVATLTSQDLST